jgi:peptide/nickel transport system permease protein
VTAVVDTDAPTTGSRRMSVDLLTVLAVLLLVVVAVAVVFGDGLTRYGFATPVPDARLQAPSWGHPFGTDGFSRDILDRVIVGARYSVTIGFAVALLSSVLGGACGIVVAVWRSLDNLVMRVLDGLIAFPPIILALFLVSIVGGGMWQVVAALTLVFLPRIARVTRGVALAIVSYPFVEASHMLGGGRLWAMTRHVLPNVAGPISVQATYVMSRAIVIDAGLAFLGLSIPPPTPTWGNMVGDARLFMAQAWWMVLVPGLCIALTAIAVNIVGDWLRDRTDSMLGEH